MNVIEETAELQQQESDDDEEWENEALMRSMNLIQEDQGIKEQDKDKPKRSLYFHGRSSLSRTSTKMSRRNDSIVLTRSRRCLKADRRSNLEFGYLDGPESGDDSMGTRIELETSTPEFEDATEFEDMTELEDMDNIDNLFGNEYIIGDGVPLGKSRTTMDLFLHRMNIMNDGNLRKSYMQTDSTPYTRQFIYRPRNLACKVMFTLTFFIALMFYVLNGTGDKYDFCTEHKIETTIGRDQCRSQCHPHMCCLETGPNSCASSAHCLDYKHCNILLNTENGEKGVSPLSKSVESLCNPMLIQTIHGRSACHDVCRTHLCCFSTNGKICAKNDLCKHYGACEILLQTTDGLPYQQKLLKREVNDTCNKYAIRSTTYGKRQCEELCAQKECCFESGHKDCEGRIDCSLFDKCSNLQVVSFNDTSIENISIDNHPTADLKTLPTGDGKDLEEKILLNFNEASVENVSIDNHPTPYPTSRQIDLSFGEEDYIENAISTLCSLSNLRSNHGKYQCSSVCNDHLCCVMDGRSNCIEGNEAICSKYSVCSNLFRSHMASTTCTADKVKSKEGWLKCYEICSSAVCCFNGKKCAEDFDCTLYEHCSVLNVEENS